MVGQRTGFVIMRLDKDLIRQILLAVEADEGPVYEAVLLEFEGRSESQVGYHVMQLVEAGYLVGEDLSSLDDELAWEAQRLTYRGHEFLDTIRDDEVWSRTKTAVGKVGGASLSMFLELGKGYAKQVIAERMGISL